MNVAGLIAVLQALPQDLTVVRAESGVRCVSIGKPEVEVVWHEDGGFTRVAATVEEFETGMVTGELGLVVVIE